MSSDDPLISSLTSQPDAGDMLSRDRTLRNLTRERDEISRKYKAAVEEIERLEKLLEVRGEIAEYDKPKLKPAPRRSKGDSSATAIIMLSDWHVEQLILPERVSGLNEYNLDIADQRISRTFDKAILLVDDARNLVDIDEVVVWLGGDFIHGHIHEEYLSSNTLHPMKACRWAATRIEAGLKQIANHAGVSKLRVYTNHGNHGRTTKKMTNATSADESYEYNMYRELSMRCPFAEWNIAEGYFNYAEIRGRNVRFHHGHKIKFGGGINGVGVPAWRFIHKSNSKMKADLDIFGHFHTFGCPGTSYISNGSLNGVDEYSESFEGDAEPKQGFAVIDSQRGLTRAIPIFCR